MGKVGIVNLFLMDGAQLLTIVGVRCLKLDKKVSICI
jgi:hypothetical protein